MLKKLKLPLLLIFTILLTLGLSLSLNYLLAAWTPPAGFPPACTSGNPGCDAPLNISNTPQQKAGMLLLNTGGSTNGLIVQSGNVGIGTTAPGAKLEVNDTTGGAGGATWIRNTVHNNENYTLRLQGDSDGDAGGPFNTVFTAAGNVGIGTMSPNTKLNVVGAAGITTFTGTSRLGVSITGAAANTNDYSGIDFTYTTQFPAARIASHYVTGIGSYLQFGTSNDHEQGITNTAMTIDYNGNVGIGTTAPGAKLEVNDTTGGAGGATWIRNTVHNNENYTLRLQGDSDGDAGGPFNTVFTAAGNVGIGAMNPGSKLEVIRDQASNSATIMAKAASAGWNANLIVTDSAGTKFVGIMGGHSADPDHYLFIDNVGDLRINKSVDYQMTGAQMNLMTIKNNGNVGIGTTNPTFGDSKVFQMTNWPRSVIRMDGGPTQSEIWAIGTEDVDNNLRIVNMTGLGLWPRNSAKGIIIQPSGNVGIGTTAPSEKLDVAGNIRASGGGINATGDICTGVTGTAKCLSTAGGGFTQNNCSWVNIGRGCACPSGQYLSGVRAASTADANTLTLTCYCCVN